jgi:hypothetical protein
VNKTGVDSMSTQIGNRIFKALHLQLKIPIPNHIGGREMGKRTRTFQTTMEIDGMAKFTDICRSHTDAVSYPYQLQDDTDRPIVSGGTFTIRKGEIGFVDRGHNVIGDKGLYRFQWRLIQEEDRSCATRLTQLDTFSDGRHGKLVGTSCTHSPSALNHPMTIAISFDRTHKLGTRAEQGLEGTRIVAYGTKINLNPRPSVRRLPHLCHPTNSLCDHI